MTFEFWSGRQLADGDSFYLINMSRKKSVSPCLFLIKIKSHLFGFYLVLSNGFFYNTKEYRYRYDILQELGFRWPTNYIIPNCSISIDTIGGAQFISQITNLLYNDAVDEFHYFFLWFSLRFFPLLFLPILIYFSFSVHHEQMMKHFVIVWDSFREVSAKSSFLKLMLFWFLFFCF